MSTVLRVTPAALLAGLLSLTGLLSLSSLLVLLVAPIGALAQPGSIPLQCRLGNGPWQDCRMQIEQVGLHWWLRIGGRELEFRHDGRGNLSMQQDRGGWRTVESRWEEDSNLCWDGVCAKGEIPLD